MDGLAHVRNILLILESSDPFRDKLVKIRPLYDQLDQTSLPNEIVCLLRNLYNSLNQQIARIDNLEKKIIKLTAEQEESTLRQMSQETKIAINIRLFGKDWSSIIPPNISIVKIINDLDKFRHKKLKILPLYPKNPKSNSLKRQKEPLPSNIIDQFNVLQDELSNFQVSIIDGSKNMMNILQIGNDAIHGDAGNRMIGQLLTWKTELQKPVAQRNDAVFTEPFGNLLMSNSMYSSNQIKNLVILYTCLKDPPCALPVSQRHRNLCYIVLLLVGALVALMAVLWCGRYLN
jgi:hypothetical protein